jgi:hypothetical protein
MSFLAHLSWEANMSGAFTATNTTGSRRPRHPEKIFYILSFVNGTSLYHYWYLFFKDKFVWNEFEQPEAGPKGKLQGCSL